MEYKNDSWKNVLSKQGYTGKDKSESTTFEGIIRLEDQTLSALYVDDGLSTSIVDVVAQDMTSKGWKILGDKDSRIVEEQRRIQVSKKLTTALAWARLYRGAIVAIVTERGELDKPLTVNSGAIKMLRVYSAPRVQFLTTDIITDPKNKYFEDFETFTVELRNGGFQEIHASRCLVFKGDTILDYECSGVDAEFLYWGFSALQKCWTKIRNLAQTESGIATLMTEFSVGVFTWSNLLELLNQNDQDSLNQIYTRLELTNASKSIINSIVLGADETYRRETANVSGVPEILDRFMISVSSASNIPVTKLFKRSPAGMNATGQFDLNDYYDMLRTKQEDDLLNPLQYLTDYMGSYVYPGNTEKYMIEFNKLREPSQKEQAEINYINAQAANLDIQNSTILPEEARLLRFPELEKAESGGEVFEEEEE